jgi:hypothetical protein
MNTPFKISFDFHLDPTHTINLEANVGLHHSIPYYRVSGISVSGRNNTSSLLPDIELICIETAGARKWVHKDSGRESELSHVVGRAIEENSNDIEIAPTPSDPLP